ncbi:Maltose phosphorylase [compost metagenome]
MYLRTSRLDLDNYNNDTEDGCHTTSMAGTWMSIVHGFGGLRVQADRLILNPSNPGHWTAYSFKIMFRGSRLKVSVTDVQVTVVNETDIPASITIFGKDYTVNGLSSVTAEGSSVTV